MNYDKCLDFDDLDKMIEIEGGDEEEINQYGKKAKGKMNVENASVIKKPKLRGLMDSFVTKKPEVVVELRKQGRLRQTNINDSLDKEKRAMACQYIGRFFYQAGIPFNCARLDAFK